MNKSERRIRNACASSIRTGVDTGSLTKPVRCSLCLKRKEVHAHHYNGYENKRDVVWLCCRCHKLIHKIKIDKTLEHSDEVSDTILIPKNLSKYVSRSVFSEFKIFLAGKALRHEYRKYKKEMDCCGNGAERRENVEAGFDPGSGTGHGSSQGSEKSQNQLKQDLLSVF